MATGCSTARKGSMTSISRSSSRLSVRSSTRMKKVAAPPPPSLKPSLSSNGMSSRDTPMTTSPPGEDCAIDELLEGRMDLDVILPDCSKIKMTVDRRMAMMDLLVQVATANKISAGGHIITAGSKDENSIHYKRNIPVGSLDTNTVYIIPKPAADLPIRKMPKLANQPFEQQTFRLQVNLPRNQRMVLRVSPHSTLAEVKQQICAEKELNHSTHHLVHPAHPETVLDLNSTLEIYGYAEISLMSNSSLRDSIRSTSTNFIAYQRPEEEKRKKGILGLFSRKKKGMLLDANSNGVNSRGVSPARSEISVRSNYQPKQSTKRKLAPAPPPAPTDPSPSPPLVIQSSKAVTLQTESEASVKTDEIGSTVSHSRHSSDSSGYHEPSVFSDCSENKSPDASVLHGNHALTARESPRPKENREMHSQKKKSSTPIKEATNLNNVASYSSVSISSTLRKRKAPQPPVPSPLPEALQENPTSETSAVASEISAFDPSENAEEVFQNSPSSVADENPQSAHVETVVEYQPIEKNEATQCDFTTFASPDPAISTVTTQPCESSCSEAIIASKDKENESVAVSNQIAYASSQSSPSLPEPQESLPSSHDFAGIDTSPTELHSSSKAPDAENQENFTCQVQPTLEKTVEDETVLVLDQQVQHCDKEDVESLSAPFLSESESSTSHSEVEATMAVLDVIVDELLQNQHSSDVVCPVKPHLDELEEKEESPTDHYEETSFSDASEVPVPIQGQTSQEADTESLNQNSVRVMDESQHMQSTEDIPFDENKFASQPGETKLPNFTLGCYQTPTDDIYDSQGSKKYPSDTQQIKGHNGISHDSVKSSDVDVNKNETYAESDNAGVPEMHTQKRKVLDVKIMSFKECEKENFDDLVTKGQVQEKRAQFIGLGAQSLGGRSVSLHNLTPKQKIVWEIVSVEDNSGSTVDTLYRTQSDQNIAQDGSEVDEKQAAFVQEQKRLYEEYQKLKAQFISWQKQLMNNQSLLQNEQIMPKIVFPTFDNLGNNLHDAPDSRGNQSELKTRSLPWPRSLPFSLKEASPVRSVSLPSNHGNTSTSTSKYGSPETPWAAKSRTSSDSNKVQMAPVQDEFKKSTQEDLCKDPNPMTPENNILPDVIYEEVKSQTLPRPKPQTNSAFVESWTNSLNRHTRPKSQVVSITIGSWQQHNEPVTDIDSSSVASVRSKFQSLENIPQGSYRSAVPVPQEPSKASTSVASERKSLASKPPSVDRSADVNNKTMQSVEKAKLPKSGQKSELNRHASKTNRASKSEMLSQSRYPKPLIRLTSMKDDFHLPSLRTCHKWPLGDMNQKDSAGPDLLRDELKASVKAPSGGVREKIHRAEVDLRHHPKKDVKVSADAHLKHKEVDLRRVSSKSEPGWTQKKYKESDFRLSKSETIPSDPKSSESCSKSESLPPNEPGSLVESSKIGAAVRPTNLHITTVSIHNSENAQDTTPPEQKSSRTEKLSYGALKYEGAESKLRTMAELKNVLAQKTAEREEANRKMQANEPSFSSSPDNGSVPPPPPPPPLASTMPVIPPAAPIPVSSQLVMGEKTKNVATLKAQSTNKPKTQESKDPREELMLEIRGFGGRQALRKVPVSQASWHLKVFGPATPSLNSS